MPNSACKSARVVHGLFLYVDEVVMVLICSRGVQGLKGDNGAKGGVGPFGARGPVGQKVRTS